MGQKITGFHAIEEALKNPNAGSTLYLAKDVDNRNSKLEQLARSNGKTFVKRVSPQALKELVNPGTDPRGAVLDLGANREHSNQALRNVSVRTYCESLKEDEGALVLILDSITDPHNIGAILRSADQFNVGLVIMPQKRSGQITETVLRISSGAARYVATSSVVNLVREMDTLKEFGFWIYGADMNGTTAKDVKFAKRSAIVMGSEGEGIGRLVRERCDQIVSIPMNGHIDSLNVSVAAGILMYEFRR